MLRIDNGFVGTDWDIRLFVLTIEEQMSLDDLVDISLPDSRNRSATFEGWNVILHKCRDVLGVTLNGNNGNMYMDKKFINIAILYFINY